MNARDRVLVSSKIVGLPRSKRYDSTIEHMLQFMPALAAEVEVNAISGMDPTRHDSPNDFFDRELLIYALAYSGTFAAIDKWLASLVSHSRRSEEHTSELQSLMRISYAVFCLKKNTTINNTEITTKTHVHN